MTWGVLELTKWIWMAWRVVTWPIPRGRNRGRRHPGAWLGRIHLSARDFDAHHLHIALALAINAVQEAEGPEFLVRNLACPVGLGL